MNKKLRIFLSLFLVLCLLAVGVLPAAAAEEEREVIHIASAREWLDLAEACRLDSFSRDKLVYLDENIDFTGLEFQPLPVFAGELMGLGHTLSGIVLEGDGSGQGLIRYASETAFIHDLKVEAAVTPGGTGERVGGIAGENAGIIRLCSFDGAVSGTRTVGGIAGRNTVTGIIDDCKISGTVSGNHFVGGAAGENNGVIRGCVNSAAINSTEKENIVDLSDISIDRLTGTESLNNVTDVGGITGTSTGVIRNCRNTAQVGYPHMGYNIGGIAGSQKGFITLCDNSGPICGRKEVGGIVGQMEPVTRVEYTADTIQILQGQLSQASSLANQAVVNTQNGADQLKQQIRDMKDYSQTASDAIKQLIPSKENPHLPDLDSLQAAKNTVTGSLTNLHGTMKDMQISTKTNAEAISGDIRALSRQLSAIQGTLNHAGENLGGTLTDVSDADTPEDQSCKVEQCENTGKVEGDVNVGGICGAIALENDMDPEDDLELTGKLSLNFEGELRSVILGCGNRGPVTCKRRNAGGVVGRMTLGLVRWSVNSGDVTCDGGTQAGGIAGTSTGFLRDCSSKSIVTGKTRVGGIAGSASVVTGCRSMVNPVGATEQVGAILGATEPSRTPTAEDLWANVYTVTGQDPGGIDGISYAGAAEPVSLEEFLALPDLMPVFRQARITFLMEGGMNKVVKVDAGHALKPEDVPAVPEQEGSTGTWEGLEEADLAHVYFDREFSPVYRPYDHTVSSQTQRDGKKPLLLAQGIFQNMQDFEVCALTELPAVGEKQQALEGWEIPVFSETEEIQVNFALPDGMDPRRAAVLVRNADGSWQETQVRPEGSYVVFGVEPGQTAFCLAENPEPVPMWIYTAAAAAAAAVLLAVLLIVRAQKKKKKKALAEAKKEN